MIGPSVVGREGHTGAYGSPLSHADSHRRRLLHDGVPQGRRVVVRVTEVPTVHQPPVTGPAVEREGPVRLVDLEQDQPVGEYCRLVRLAHRDRMGQGDRCEWTPPE